MVGSGRHTPKSPPRLGTPDTVEQARGLVCYGRSWGREGDRARDRETDGYPRDSQLWRSGKTLEGGDITNGS